MFVHVTLGKLPWHMFSPENEIILNCICTLHLTAFAQKHHPPSACIWQNIKSSAHNVTTFSFLDNRNMDEHDDDDRVFQTKTGTDKKVIYHHHTHTYTQGGGVCFLHTEIGPAEVTCSASLPEHYEQ